MHKVVVTLSLIAATSILAACGGDDGPAVKGGSGGAAAPGTALPCDVVAVLQQHCVDCHGTHPRMGAPISLVTPADFQRTKNGMTWGAIVLDRVQSASRPMPLPPRPRLVATEIATLQAWVAGGSLGVANGCALTEPTPTQGSGGAPVNTNTGGSPSPADAGVHHDDAGKPPITDTANWNMFGSDLTNSRSNGAETVLSATSVKSLKQHWMFMGPGVTGTPAVVDGVVYVPGWDGKVYALHANDGTPVWTTPLPHLIDSSPSVTATQIFVGDNFGSVYALNRTDGKMQWTTPVSTHAQAHLWSSPIYIEDAQLVVVGVASGEESLMEPYSFRGSVVGLDANTGVERWRFYTTDNDQKSGPGISIWSTAAVDTKRKLIFVGTGNNYGPPSGPYADSMLAIDYNTGALVWSKQFTKDDIFTVPNMQGPDFDIGSTPNLFSAGGKDLIGIGIKNGIYYALDRDHGEMQWMAMLTEGSVLGGVISASAYANGLVFVASNRFLEGKTDLVALEAATGHEAWRYNAEMVTYGGVAHANGVVYLGTTGGTIIAIDAMSGAKLWSADAPDAIAGGPSIAGGQLFVPWGYTWTLGRETAGSGG